MDAKKRSDLIDKIEEIQNKNYNHFKGVNEADLATREEIADLFEQLLNEELIGFGNYLLSDVRNETKMKHPEFNQDQKEESLKRVSHADLSNWFDTQIQESDVKKSDILNTTMINRVEVIDEKGRSYVNWKPTNRVQLQVQDNGRTLKVFVSKFVNRD